MVMTCKPPAGEHLHMHTYITLAYTPYVTIANHAVKNTTSVRYARFIYMMHHYQNRCLDEPSARAQRLHSIQMLAPSLAHRAQVFIY